MLRLPIRGRSSWLALAAKNTPCMWLGQIPPALAPCLNCATVSIGRAGGSSGPTMACISVSLARASASFAEPLRSALRCGVRPVASGLPSG